MNILTKFSRVVTTIDEDKNKKNEKVSMASLL
jgi:hypothetical protein